MKNGDIYLEPRVHHVNSLELVHHGLVSVVKVPHRVVEQDVVDPLKFVHDSDQLVGV